MSQFSTSPKLRGTSRADDRRRRLHLESLEGRVVLSTLVGPVSVPIAALAHVSTTSTLDPMADKAQSPGRSRNSNTRPTPCRSRT